MIAQNHIKIRNGFALLFEKVNMTNIILNQKYYQFLQKNQLKRKDPVYLMHVNNFKIVQFSAANN